MSITTKLRAAGLTAVAAVAVVALTGAAGAGTAADRVQLEGQRTTLTPSSALGDAGVTLAPLGRASAGEGGSLVLPIVRGRVDPQNLRGRIVHQGRVKLTRGERSLRLRRLIIRTTKRGSVLTAKLGRRGCGRALRRDAQRRVLRRGAQGARRGARRLGALRGAPRRCGRIVLARLTNVRRQDAGGLLAANADLTLTRAAARRINRRLGAQVVSGGARLGTAKVEAKPRS